MSLKSGGSHNFTPKLEKNFESLTYFKIRNRIVFIDLPKLAGLSTFINDTFNPSSSQTNCMLFHNLFHIFLFTPHKIVVISIKRQDRG